MPSDGYFALVAVNFRFASWFNVTRAILKGMSPKLIRNTSERTTTVLLPLRCLF